MLRDLLLVASLGVLACSTPSSEAPPIPLPQAPMYDHLPNFDQRWDYADPAKTEGVFRELLAQVGADAPLGYRLELQTQIARTLGLQRRFEAAHDELDGVAAALAAAAEDDPDLWVARVRHGLERGRALNSGGDRAASRPVFQEVFEYAEGLPNSHSAPIAFHVVDAAHMLGIVEQGEAGARWSVRALELAQASTCERTQGWEGSLTNNLGWSFHDQGHYQEAYAMFVQNQAYWEKRGQARRANIAKWSMGRTLRSMGRNEAALQVQNELLAGWSAEDGGPSGYVYEELGECTLLLEGEEAARPHFAKAHAMLSPDEWLQANEPDRLARLARLAGLAR